MLPLFIHKQSHHACQNVWKLPQLNNHGVDCTVVLQSLGNTSNLLNWLDII